MDSSVNTRALMWPGLGALSILPSSLASSPGQSVLRMVCASDQLLTSQCSEGHWKQAPCLMSNESLPRWPERLPGHHGSITYTYVRSDKRCGGAEVFEDQNTLQHGTLTSCGGGTRTSTHHCLCQTLLSKRLCPRDRG